MSYALHHGRWQDALSGTTCDLLLSDPPYSGRVHRGYRTNETGRGVGDDSGVSYDELTPDMVGDFVASWAHRVRQWVVLFCDHIAFRWWEEAWQLADWQTFAPVWWVKRNPTPRMCGDGPTSPGDLMLVARPAGWPRDRGSRRGAYDVGVPQEGMAGVKDVAGLVEVVSDYSRPGDTVADPFAGTATVGAAVKLAGGRIYEGAEVRSEVHAKGLERLRLTPPCPPGYVVDRWAGHGAQGRLEVA